MSPTDQTSTPDAAPPVVGRAQFEEALAKQVVREKAITRLNDTVSAARRRLPMTPLDDYRFAGADGPITLVELFGERRLLMLQHFMFAPDWEDGCPACTYATDNLPWNPDRLGDEGIAFAMVSQAPVEKLERWRAKRGWPHRWVSSQDTTFHHDWGWTQTDDQGHDGPVPGYSFYLLRDGAPYLTYFTRGRGVEAQLPLPQIMDRTVYGRQEDWEDSPRGWPQYPTYG